MCSLSAGRGGVRGRDSLGLGLAGLLATPPGPGTATVSRPVPSLGSLSPTFTDKEEGAAGSVDDAGDTKDGCFPALAAWGTGTDKGDFRLGEISLGSRALLLSRELDFVGETIFNLGSSGLVWLDLSMFTLLPAGSDLGSRGETWCDCDRCEDDRSPGEVDSRSCANLRKYLCNILLQKYLIDKFGIHVT